MAVFRICTTARVSIIYIGICATYIIRPVLHCQHVIHPQLSGVFFHAPTRAIVNGDIINKVMGRCLAVRLRKSCSPGAVISPMQSKETDSIYTGNALKQSR